MVNDSGFEHDAQFTVAASVYSTSGRAVGFGCLEDVTIIHRIGRLEAGDQIVLVGAASPHRQAAFDAAQFIMDFLKTDAPFWKAEERGTETSWVDARESDDAARKRWTS